MPLERQWHENNWKVSRKNRRKSGLYTSKPFMFLLFIFMQFWFGQKGKLDRIRNGKGSVQEPTSPCFLCPLTPYYWPGLFSIGKAELLWKALRIILHEDDHSANYGQIPVVNFLMWALLMIYRQTITAAEKHLLETGLRPPIHFIEATEVKCSLVSFLIWA